MPSLSDAVGVGFAVIADEHFLSFMLSSPGTARNLYKGDPVAMAGIALDLNIAFGLSLGFSLVLALLLRSWLTALIGGAFGAFFYFLYKKRAGL